MILRPYQTASIDAVERGWREFQRQLLVLPTGCGKTIVFAHLAAREAEHGKRVMILAHREELLEQAADKIRRAVCMETGLERGSSHAHNSLWPITVASVQTLHPQRLQRWPQRSIDLLIVDEAHHILADSYRRIIDHFNCRLLGVTATPDRGDKLNLGEVFENIAYEYSIKDAIKDGHLSQLVAKLLPVKIDLSGVRTKAGDYDANDLDAKITPYLQAIVQSVKEHAADRKILSFLPLIRTSELFARLCNEAGIRAVHVDGGSEDRAEKLADFAAGNKYQMLCNSALLFEGYDCPAIDCVLNLRPTKSRALYSQTIGRGTRLAPGKKNLLILDFLWQTAKHELCVPASLFAKSKEEAEQIMKVIGAAGGGGEKDILEAAQDAKEARERSLAESLKMQARKTARYVNPLDFALSIHSDDLAEYEPTMKWEAAAPSDKQLSLIRKMGIDDAIVTCKGHASKIIDTLLNRRREGLCTVFQAQTLTRAGIDAGNLSFERASLLIDGLKRKAVVTTALAEEW